MKYFTEEEKNLIKKEIMELLNDKKARDAIDIIKYLNYGKETDSEIVKIINEMVEEYDLYLTKKGRYLNFKDSEDASFYYKGIFMTTKNEFGFVRVNDLNEDIFIHGSNKNTALDGDLVLVHITSGETDTRHCEGEIVKVLKRNKNTKLGEVVIKNNKYYCILKNNKKLDTIELMGDNLERLVDGDIITFSLITDKNLKANFKERIGHKNDPGIDITAVLAEHDFNVTFKSDALEQLKTIPTEVTNQDINGRLDLRDEMIFTIDGDDTKDIDDAISVKKLDNGHFELGVHIANVPYYIKENSPLDLEARERGTSVYLADRVVPMYPHQISNGICSLNPGVDRLTISSFMEIDENGKVLDYRIVESVINSKIQMTYKNVNKILEQGEIPVGYEEFVDKLHEMKELADLVRKNKINRGYIDFDIDEVKIIVDEEGNVLDIEKRYRGSGEKMIEDFMILANESVAETITNLGLTGVYRIHGDVSVDRLRKFLHILKNYNINIKDDFKFVNQKTIQNILSRISNLDGFQVLATRMISCMDKARYSTNNIGHFALASRNYTHFTSPIRRYPDTTIHRLLHDYLFGNLTDDVVNHWENVLEDICITSSERERAAMDCERVVDDMKMAEYMESHIGEVYSGMVSGITSFGMYVMLPNLVEGMVRLSDLPEKFYYDEETESLIGANSHKLYTLGTKVDIKVTNASKETRQIDFILYDKEKESVVDYVQEKVKKIKKKY
ncbi:MAG: ribonuclease R [Bacilli bacterium]|nr:ribonuclease R [Bacilli bacterium]